MFSALSADLKWRIVSLGLVDPQPTFTQPFRRALKRRPGSLHSGIGCAHHDGTKLECQLLSLANTPCSGGLDMVREEIYFTVVVVSIVLMIDVMGLYVYFKMRP
jgi:hypothetical protein